MVKEHQKVIGASLDLAESATAHS